MKESSHAIAPAFKKLPNLPVANKVWLLRMLSLLASASRLFFRWSERVIATEHAIPVRDAGEVKVIEVTPKSLIGVAPAIVYYHGGGFFMSYGGLHLKKVEAYAEQLRVRLFFVEYRLSTQQPFPGALMDCVSALDWVHDNAESLQVDRDRVAVMGDSAGGCLAASVAQLVCDENEQRQQPKPIRAQFLIYPVLDCDCKTPSARSFHDTPVWNTRNNQVMWQVYLPGIQDDVQALPPAYASPAHRHDFRGLPSAYIESAEYDPLRDEAHAYADALTAAGVHVVRLMVKGAVHAYDFVDCEISRSAENERLTVMRELLCDE